MDFDHSVDSNTIKISAFIRSSIGTEGTDVSKRDSCSENEKTSFENCMQIGKAQTSPLYFFQEAVSFTATMPQSESANAIGTVTGDSFFSWQNSLVK